MVPSVVGGSSWGTRRRSCIRRIVVSAAGGPVRTATAAMVVLFLIGFGLIGLASAVDSSWPLFVTVIPYSIIPWLVVHADDPTAPPTEG